MVVPQRAHLEKQALWRADTTAIYDVDSDTEVSYADLNERANRLANALHDRGVRYNDRVALQVFNTVAFPVALYGCFKLGAVPVVLNYRLTAEDNAHVLETVNEQAFVFDAATADLALDARELAGSQSPCLTVGEAPVGDRVTDALAAASAATPAPISRSPDDISYMFCTSGTTGRPKVVAHSARSGSERVRVSISESETTPESVWVAFLPWFHGSGIDTVVRASVTAGASFVAARDYSDPSTAMDVVQDYPVTHVMTVPTVTDRFVRHDASDDVDFDAVECWRHTGEVLTEHQARRFSEEITPNIYNSYGSSEGGLNAMLRPEDLPEHAGSVGRPVAGDEIRLIELDNDRHVEPTETVEPGERGEVVVRSDQLFFGYFEDRVQTDERVYDGWYYTHDVGVVEDGRLYVKGRTDDMILTGGELVSGVEVEDAVAAHPAVDDAVVVGATDETWGERIVAFVVGDCTESDLDAYLTDSGGLANYKRPREYRFVDSIEQTGSGKKQRARYKDLAEQQ